MHRILLVFSLLTCGAVCLAAAQPATPGVDYDEIARRIVDSLKLEKGERVLMRFDPGCFAGLVEPLRSQIRAAKAVALSPLKAGSPLTGQALRGTDVFLWLPLGKSAAQLSETEQEALEHWLAGGGARRELHFHWAEGTRGADGLPEPQPADFDALYQAALDIDYATLNAAQDRAIEVLNLGTVRINSPSGTDFMFRVGVRQFNKQNGDASPARARSARVRADREIELPAGALRVAPVEESAFGQIAIPEARFGDIVAKKVAILVDNGRITGVRAEQGLEALKAALLGDGAAGRFGEFSLGFNPKLAIAPGSRAVPYYGYGAGVIRLGFGNNEAAGGKVGGGPQRWFFLTDASLHVDFRYLVRGGKLVLETVPAR